MQRPCGRKAQMKSGWDEVCEVGRWGRKALQGHRTWIVLINTDVLCDYWAVSRASCPGEDGTGAGGLGPWGPRRNREPGGVFDEPGQISPSVVQLTWGTTVMIQADSVLISGGA